MAGLSRDEFQKLADQVTRQMLRVGTGTNPGYGNAINDTWPSEDNVDGTNPLNVDFIIPGNLQRLASARLSFRLRQYRTYNNFSATVTGAGTSHSHSHNHASHSHTHGNTHNHNISAASPGTNNPLLYDQIGNQWQISGGPSTLVIPNVSPGSTDGTTPTTDATAEASHSHSISVTSTLGITLGAVATSVTVKVDGVDVTAAIGGPFSSDQVELDVRKFIVPPNGPIAGGWHTIQLQPSGLGRIHAALRLSMFVDGSIP